MEECSLEGPQTTVVGLEAIDHPWTGSLRPIRPLDHQVLKLLEVQEPLERSGDRQRLNGGLQPRRPDGGADDLSTEVFQGPRLTHPAGDRFEQLAGLEEAVDVVE